MVVAEFADVVAETVVVVVALASSSSIVGAAFVADAAAADAAAKAKIYDAAYTAHSKIVKNN